MATAAAGLHAPPVLTGQPSLKAALTPLIDSLEQSQWLPAEELARRQYRQLRPLAHHAAAHSPLFRERLHRAGLVPDDLATPAGLGALPLLGRRELQHAREDAFCATVPGGHAPLSLSSSSGSTGEPVDIRKTLINRLDWQAMTMRVHRWHTPGPKLRFASVRAKLPKVATIPDWGPPSNLFFPSGEMLGIPNNVAITRQAELLAGFSPDILLIYPSNLDALIELIRSGRAAPFPLLQIRTIGEMLAEPIRAAAQALWGCPVIDTYSSDEVGYVALQCPASGLYHLSELLIVEILDEEGRPCPEGRPGRVVLTDLRNFATPLIRYEIGDYAEPGGPCPCGRGLPTLRRINGRERNLIVMPDGSRNWPLNGRPEYRSVAPVIQFQMIQHDRERLEMRLVVEAALSAGQEEALREIIRRAVGHPFAIDFRYFNDRLPIGANGKLEEFISQVPIER